MTAHDGWKAIRRRYETAFRQGGAYGWIVTHGERDIAYVVCAMQPMRWSATFQQPTSLWNVLTFVVRPEYRGIGIGRNLFIAMEERISRFGMSARLAGVTAGNDTGMRFLSKRDFKAAWLTMVRSGPLKQPVRFHGKHHIEVAGVDLVTALKPLWLELHHHHQLVSPNLGPYVEDVPSWSVIRGLLEKGAREGLLLVARAGSRIVGLASAAIHEGGEDFELSDEWETGQRVAETKFLIVSPDHRGEHIGAALLDRVDEIVTRQGAVDQVIGAVAQNSSAIRFYESRGFRQAWLEYVKW
ncbi:MAG: GNAT family N-acetyltransferase [Mesorhizobium sp.]